MYVQHPLSDLMQLNYYMYTCDIRVKIVMLELMRLLAMRLVITKVL